MSWAHRFMVVPDPYVALARGLAAGIAPPPSAEGMWTTGLSASGAAPATHWISHGLIQSEFATLLGDAQATYAAAGGSVPLANIQALYAASTIRSDLAFEGGAQVGLATMGLHLVEGSLP